MTDTMKTTLRTVWFWRKMEDGPEMLMAWDEYTVDQNPEGYAKAWQEAYDAAKSDDSGFGVRHIDIRIPWAPVENAFLPATVEGVVSDEDP